MKKNSVTKTRNKKIRILIILFLLLFAFIGASYAWLTLTVTGTKSNVIKAGTLSLKLDESLGEGILLENAIPMDDNEGISQSNLYKFIVNNDGDISNQYTIYLEDVAIDTNEVRMSDNNIKYRLIKNNVEGQCKLVSTLENITNKGRVLDSDTLEPNESNSYTLQVWMDYNAGNDAQDTVFNTRLKIDASQIIE